MEIWIAIYILMGFSAALSCYMKGPHDKYPGWVAFGACSLVFALWPVFIMTGIINKLYE